MSDEKFTEEQLNDMSRVLLRRTAMKVLGIDNTTASKLGTEDLIAQILESQDGGGKSKGKKGGKPASKPAPEPEEEAAEEVVEEEPKPRGRRAAPAPKEEESGPDALMRHVVAIGKGQDEELKALKDMVADLTKVVRTLAEVVREIDRKTYVNLGLTNQIYTFTGEPDELDGTVAGLEKNWDEAQGNE